MRTRSSCCGSRWRPRSVICPSSERRSTGCATSLSRLRNRGPRGARSLFEQLLLAGRPAIGVIEALDHHGLWEQLVPEWANVRSRPQHNPYHRFTVDRHLLETVAAASQQPVERPQLLVLAALLHDLGKVGSGDHTAIGVDLAEVVGRRIGCDDGDIEVLQTLVRHHLLLSEVASRRDLDDDATIDLVADAVGSVVVLHLLAALTAATRPRPGRPRGVRGKPSSSVRSSPGSKRGFGASNSLPSRTRCSRRGRPRRRGARQPSHRSRRRHRHRRHQRSARRLQPRRRRPRASRPRRARSGRRTRRPTAKRCRDSASSTGCVTRRRGPTSPPTSIVRCRGDSRPGPTGRPRSHARSAAHHRQPRAHHCDVRQRCVQ